MADLTTHYIGIFQFSDLELVAYSALKMGQDITLVITQGNRMYETTAIDFVNGSFVTLRVDSAYELDEKGNTDFLGGIYARKSHPKDQPTFSIKPADFTKQKADPMEIYRTK